jgi:hypothetical protein
VKRIIALIAVSSALLLTGCSQVGVAATVGSTKITQATVQKSVDAVLAERAKVDTTSMQLDTGATLNRNQLRFHLMSALLNDVAVDAKVTVTKAEIDSRRATLVTQVGGQAKLPSALVSAGIASIDFDAYVQLIIASEKIAQAEVAAGVTQANTGVELQRRIIAKANLEKVTVNPRYGKWDSATGDVVATDAASPAATPAASATATP